MAEVGLSTCREPTSERTRVGSLRETKLSWRSGSMVVQKGAQQPEPPGLRNRRSRASSSGDFKVSTASFKHFHGAALDYVWRREAARSRNWRIQLYVLMEVPDSSRLAMGIAIFLSVAIVAQLIIIYLQDNLQPKTEFLSDVILTAIFTIEFFVRAGASVGAAQGRALLCNAFFYLDAAAILPFYIGLAIDPDDYMGNTANATNDDFDAGSAGQALEILRLLRIVRIFKLTRTYPGAALLSRALYISAPALLVPLAFLVIGAAFFGAVVYFFEKMEASLSGGETAFPRVTEALWFMIVTFSTVGYGDVTPNTNAGKTITVFAIIARSRPPNARPFCPSCPSHAHCTCALVPVTWQCGVIFMSMPITIVGNNFAAVLEEKEKLAVVLSIQQHLIDRNMRAENILDLFDELDENLDGAIDYKEFKKFVMSMGVDLKPSSLRRLFSVFDEDGSGSITCKEFCHLVFPDVDIDVWEPDKLEQRESSYSLGGGGGGGTVSGGVAATEHSEISVTRRSGAELSKPASMHRDAEHPAMRRLRSKERVLSAIRGQERAPATASRAAPAAPAVPVWPAGLARAGGPVSEQVVPPTTMPPAPPPAAPVVDLGTTDAVASGGDDEAALVGSVRTVTPGATLAAAGPEMPPSGVGSTHADYCRSKTASDLLQNLESKARGQCGPARLKKASSSHLAMGMAVSRREKRLSVHKPPAQAAAPAVGAEATVRRSMDSPPAPSQQKSKGNPKANEISVAPRVNASDLDKRLRMLEGVAAVPDGAQQRRLGVIGEMSGIMRSVDRRLSIIESGGVPILSRGQSSLMFSGAPHDDSEAMRSDRSAGLAGSVEQPGNDLLPTM